MFEIDVRSRTPVFIQIKDQVMLLIQLGILKPNEQIPSIRELSKQLSLNVNTVKRAYSELEIEGVIYSIAGRGSFVSENAFSNSSIKENALRNLSEAINSSIPKGVTKEDVIKLVEKIFGDGVNA